MLRTRRKNRSQGASPTIVLTPLIDTALTLLVIFMVATPMMHRSIKVDLPKGQMDELKLAKQQQDIVVHIDKRAELYLNGNHIDKNSLIAGIKKLMKAHAQEAVIVKADEAVPYGTVISLVDMIKHVGGISYVALATQKPRAGL